MHCERGLRDERASSMRLARRSPRSRLAQCYGVPFQIKSTVAFQWTETMHHFEPGYSESAQPCFPFCSVTSRGIAANITETSMKLLVTHCKVQLRLLLLHFIIDSCFGLCNKATDVKPNPLMRYFRHFRASVFCESTGARFFFCMHKKIQNTKGLEKAQKVPR